LQQVGHGLIDCRHALVGSEKAGYMPFFRAE
jgi:hypothetical protein